jgi:hypothetical protein
VKKEIDRKLLVYIQKDEAGPVFIEVVETTKNGHSYRLNGDLWNRGGNFFCREICTNQKGVIWKIAPLKRDYVPNWAADRSISVCPDAQERYDLWLLKNLHCKQ